MKTKYSLQKKRLIFFILIFFSFHLHSQIGQNDSTFNTPDSGIDAIYKGPNYEINLSDIQPDQQKIVLVGSFSKYNSQPFPNIVRIFPDGSIDNTLHKANKGFDERLSALAIQPDNKIIIGGNFTTFNEDTVNRIVRFQENGDIDKTFQSGKGFDNWVSQIQVLNTKKILVLGWFGHYNDQPVKKLIRLNEDGIIDTTFHASDSTFTLNVNRFLILPDQKILVARMKEATIDIIRLYPDGSLDTSYRATLVNFKTLFYPTVMCMALQADGKLLIGGHGFISQSSDLHFLRRVNADGTADTTFTFPFSEGNSGSIRSINIQPDGKIIIAGHKFHYEPLSFSHAQLIMRLHPNGAIDDTFIHANPFYGSTYSGSSFIVNRTILFPDGKILAAGLFTEINAFTAHNIALLNTDGTLDISFNKTTGVNGTIRTSAIQTDQKIVIAGLFSAVQNNSRNHIARLLPNGSIDNSFDPGKGTNGFVYAVAIQQDGKIIIGGEFTLFNNQTVQNIVRINADGSIDATYDVKTNGPVYSLELAPDNKLLLAGHFDNVNNTPRNDIARVNPNGSLNEAFAAEIVPGGLNKISSTYILSDGKILAGGFFTAKHNTVVREHLVRLDSDGLLDSTFQQVDKSDYRDISVQPDGKILACGGKRPDWLASSIGFVERYNSNGSFDTNWKSSYNGNMQPTCAIALLPSGKVLAGGESDLYPGMGKFIALFDSTGVIDSTFTGNTNGHVYTIQLVANDRVILGGEFHTYDGIIRNNITRIFGSEPIITTIGVPYNNPSFTIYPNPATNYLYADHLVSGSIVTIRNVLGAVVYNERVNTTFSFINVNNYPNGTYFITQQNQEHTSTQRFVINKN